MKQFVFTSLLLLVTLVNLANIPRHSFIHISRKDGLSSNDVYDICQDEKGFYWVATDNGLQRFDGKRWVTPVYADPETVPSKPVQQVISLNDSMLLLKIGETYGLFNKGNFRFKAIPVDAEKHRGESFLWEDSQSNIFLVFKGEAILWLDETKNVFTEKLPLNLPGGLKPLCIFEDVQKSQYWIGGAEGLIVYDALSKETYTDKNNPQNLPLLTDPTFRNVSSVYIDTSRKHWIVYGNEKQSYACYSEREHRFVPEFSKLTSYYKGSFEVNGLFQSVEGEMWFYGRSALFNYYAASGDFYNNKSDLMASAGARFASVRSIMQDREKGIWIATNEGLYQFYTVLPAVENIIMKTDNDDNNITSVEELDNGDIWMSSRGKGVLSLTFGKGRNNVDYLFNNAPGDAAYAVKHALDVHQHKITGKIWIACVRGTLIIADHAKKTSSVLRPAAFGGDVITSVSEDAEGKLWFGTLSGNIIVYDFRLPLTDASFTRVTSIKGQVAKLMSNKNGTLWICTSNNGLFAFNINTRSVAHHYRQIPGKRESISSNNVTSIIQLSDSIYAVATDLLDILNVNTNTVRSLSFQDGLLSNTILGMQKDRQDFLWIATSNGVCRYNYARNKFTAYEEKDGFMNYETVGTAGELLLNGRIVFAGRNSLVTFPPELLNKQDPPPAVTITDLKVLNSYMPLNEASGKFEFGYRDNSLNIFFSSMSYLLKDKLTYYYKLSGIDKQWVRADNQLAAVYTLLPSGNYTFEVKCENEEGIFSPTTTLTFVIHPPFWKTWWFMSLVVLGIISLLFLFHRLRVKRIIALAELRNRVARDLHDDVGSTLSTISILSTMAKGKLAENPVQAGDYINKISDNSQQMMDAMDDIVWSIKPMNDSMQKIIARMREFASGALEPKNIDIDFEVDERVPHLKLDTEARRDLFLIFKEAVNNLAKYAGCTNVMIRIAYQDKKLLLKIKDNGKGFDVDNADNGNGISNMKKRAALLNGRIQWHSDQQSGTLVLLSIPVKK